MVNRPFHSSFYPSTLYLDFQENDRNSLRSKHEEAQASLSALQKESLVLKSALDTIMQVFTLSDNQGSPSEGKKSAPAQLCSGKDAVTMPTSPNTQQVESEQAPGDLSLAQPVNDIQPQWLHSPVSFNSVFCTMIFELL